eukprot:763260-Hanusia_phi.AAC.1
MGPGPVPHHRITEPQLARQCRFRYDHFRAYHFWPGATVSDNLKGLSWQAPRDGAALRQLDNLKGRAGWRRRGAGGGRASDRASANFGL